MNEQYLKNLLEQIKTGEIDINEGIARLKDFSFKDLGFAKIDNHRKIRTGYPEVIYCQGKAKEQVRDIIKYMLTTGNNILATRATEEMYEEVKKESNKAMYHSLARTITIEQEKLEITKTAIAVITAGTSDMSVAEEAAITAEIFGNKVMRFFDVGVAGIHRLYDSMPEIRQAKVNVVVAGMEGALPSIVGGIVDKPVIAVPTSIGYGANFGGLSALLGMLTSCASGVSVVNIDNGFGAGYLASMINKL